jgi:predicted hydrocarbon binding protein
MENPDINNGDEIKPPVAFFLMPVDILKGVHEELSEILGPETASKIIYNCGVRSGKNIVNDMDISFPSLDALSTTLPELWLQLGIGVFTIEILDKDHVKIVCEDSNEAQALGYTGERSCNLTCGFLAGMLSTIFERKYRCEEKSCTSCGDSQCIFELNLEE